MLTTLGPAVIQTEETAETNSGVLKAFLETLQNHVTDISVELRKNILNFLTKITFMKVIGNIKLNYPATTQKFGRNYCISL
jgi:hypothetical protein